CRLAVGNPSSSGCVAVPASRQGAPPEDVVFFFKQKTAYDIGLGIPAEPLFRSLITISTTPVIAGDSFEMDAVGALRLSPLRRGLAIDSTVDIFTFYVPHRHVYGEQWIKFMKDGVNATPLPTVNTTGYI